MSSNDSGVTLTTTAVGWAAVIAIAGTAAYVTSQRRKTEQPAPPKKSRNQSSEVKKDKSAKKQRLDSFHSDSQDVSKGKEKSYANAVSSGAQRKLPNNTAYTSDDGIDNAEFARQFANAREGTKFRGKSGAENKKQKSVKQSQAVQLGGTDGLQEVSAPSSTTGADADDDQSPAVSPKLTATDASGVGDMLEAAPAGPSVLRIVGTDKVKAQQPKKAKEPEKVETKKQRQRRKAREAEKEVAQLNEADRKKKEEQQRRTAREARGESAKDGSKFMAHINGNKNTAWGQPEQNGQMSKTVTTGTSILPLDTFDASDVVTSSNASSTNEASQPLADSWVTDLPSEEEQMKKLQEMDDWNTVPTKATKRSQKKTPGEKTENTPPPTKAATKPTPAATNTSSRPQKPLQSFGSYSALEDKMTPQADEEEKEWDV